MNMLRGRLGTCAIGLAFGLMVGGMPWACAAEVDGFAASPTMQLFQGKERGSSWSIEAAPAGIEGSSAKIAWMQTHGSLFELYYARDVRLPGTEQSLEGKLQCKIYTDTPDSVTGLAIRVKDKTGEIFHFAVPAKPAAGHWLDVSVPINQTAHSGHWGGTNSPTMTGPLLITGYAVMVNPNAPAGAVWLASVTWNKTAATGAPPVIQPPTPSAYSSMSELVGQYNLDDAFLLAPFWTSRSIKGETVLFIQEKESDLPTGTLLFTPASLQKVVQARDGTVYEEGRDFTVDASGRRLILTANSRIPFLKHQDLYKQKGEKQAIREKAGDSNTWLLYAEQFFQGKQVAVDYTTTEAWKGYRPQFAGDALKSFIAKLQAKRPVTIVLLGDSITAGANASSKGYAPHMPPWGVLVAFELEKHYSTKVQLVRLGVGGATSDGGVKKIPEVCAAKPDLVIIAFGMNDVAGHNPAAYARNTKAMIEGIHADNPQTAVILVASSCANPEWNWSPWDQFPKYRDALATLCGGNVALADMTTLWREILERKRYHDLTGNGINHPNDYGHRLMAQVILGMLVAPDAAH